MLERSNLPLIGDLCRQMCAELRLATGSLQKDHQATRHRQCEITAVVILDQLQCEIDARGYTGGGVESAVLNIDLVRHHLGGWKTLGKFRGMLPMRRRIHPVEEARRSEKKCTGAYRAISPRPRRAAPQPGVQILARIGHR